MKRSIQEYDSLYTKIKIKNKEKSLVILTTSIVRGRVQIIFVKNNVKMTFRGSGVKTHDVSRLLTGHLLRARGRQVTLWGEGGRGEEGG